MSSKSVHPHTNSSADDEAHSPMFHYYRQHFRNIGGQMTYEQLRTVLPERFDLAVLNSVFQSWDAVTNGKLGSLSLDDPYARFEIIFDHDHHLYRSDSYISHCLSKQGTERKLNIKLPNNGFIYPHSSELNVFKSANASSSIEYFCQARSVPFRSVSTPHSVRQILFKSGAASLSVILRL
jgi:hypothetical protein